MGLVHARVGIRVVSRSGPMGRYGAWRPFARHFWGAAELGRGDLEAVVGGRVGVGAEPGRRAGARPGSLRGHACQLAIGFGRVGGGGGGARDHWPARMGGCGYMRVRRAKEKQNRSRSPLALALAGDTQHNCINIHQSLGRASHSASTRAETAPRLPSLPSTVSSAVPLFEPLSSTHPLCPCQPKIFHRLPELLSCLFRNVHFSCPPNHCCLRQTSHSQYSTVVAVSLQYVTNLNHLACLQNEIVM